MPNSNSHSSSSSSSSSTPNSIVDTSTGSTSAASLSRRSVPPPIVIVSAKRESTKFGAQIAYSPIRRNRNSMTKLDIMENVLASEKCELTEDFVDQQIHHKKATTKISFDAGGKEYALPGSLAESQVVREKPSLRTRLLVCFLSGCVVVLCLIKLFYWK